MPVPSRELGKSRYHVYPLRSHLQGFYIGTLISALCPFGSTINYQIATLVSSRALVEHVVSDLVCVTASGKECTARCNVAIMVPGIPVLHAPTSLSFVPKDLCT